MPDTLPVSTKLENISSKAWEHPADRAATAALGSIPMLDTVVRRLIEYGFERGFRAELLGSAVRVGPKQLPDVWRAYLPVLTTLDMPDQYDLYVTNWPIVNAAAVGAGKPFIVLNSSLVSLLDEAELQTVLAHEVGHILADHVLYRTALLILLRLTGVGRLPFLAGLPLLAVQAALLEWSRASELSCDRAATLVNRDPRITCRTLMTISGGIKSSQLDLDAFMTQALEYEQSGDAFEKVSRFFRHARLTHGLPVRRAREVMLWVQGGDYDRILRGEYPTRDQEPDARREAADATDHYSERFRGFVREAGDTVAKAGDQVTNAGEQLSDWLRKRRP